MTVSLLHSNYASIVKEIAKSIDNIVSAIGSSYDQGIRLLYALDKRQQIGNDASINK